MKKKTLLSIITIIITVLQGLSQDIHFSQFYETPMIINPALTGVFNGDIRAVMNYKDQWRSIENPYKTAVISYDMKLFTKRWDNTYLGAGIIVFNDKAGKSEFGTTQVNFSLSSIVSLNAHNAVSAGLQGGFAQRGINNPDLNWGDQFDGYGPNLPTEETNFSTEPFFYGDFSAGLNWNYTTSSTNIISNDQIRANVGIALFHLNKPKQQFFAEYAGIDSENLYSKLIFHGRVYIGIKKTVSIVPGILFCQQGHSQEIIAGTMIRYMLKEESKYTGYVKESAIFIGGYFRAGDAFIPSVAFEIANFALGISYDINISGLKTVSNGLGGIEFSLRFINPSPFRYSRSVGGPML